MAKLDSDIAALDLEPICFKVCLDEGWSVERVDAGELNYRIFMQTIRDNPGVELAPTKEIDTIWHHHILDTSKYIDDCNRLFGRYIHHFPYSGVLDEENAQDQQERFQRSQALMNSNIG